MTDGEMVALKRQLDDVYTDRNGLALLAGRLAQLVGYEVRWGVDPQEPDWPVLFIQLPTGQLSWHIPKTQACLQAPDGGVWDGHTNLAKAARIALFMGADDAPDGR